MTPSTLTTSLLLPMVQTDLSDTAGTAPGTGLPLTVTFGDGAVQITPQRPPPPAAFTAVFGDATLTIIP